MPTWLSVARAPSPLTSDALMARAALACAAVRSVGSPVPAPAARPLKVAAAMFASFAFVTASSEICPVPTWLSVARAPSPLTSDALMASAVLASAAVRSVGSPVPALAARPLKVAAAMSASFAFVTASSEICPEPTWLSVARAPRPLTSDVVMASAVLACAALRSAGSPVPAPARGP